MTRGRRAARAVLVTGATGFIGRAVVRHLLGAGSSVVALARTGGDATAGARVERAVGCPVDGSRLRVVAGDLAAPGGGLEAGTLAWLRGAVDAVIHCAGDPTFVPEAPGDFRAGHVDGPRALLMGLGGGLRRWTQLSTAFVCGRRTGRVLESEGDVGQAFHNPYERVKLEAEAAVRAAGAGVGVDVRIVRPSIVVGAAPPTAGGTPTNLFFDFLRLAATLGGLAGDQVALRIAARPAARFNIVPVEHVAAALVAFAERADATGGTFHVVVSDPPTQAATLGMIAERLGLGGVRLVEEALRDPSPRERRVARMLAPYQDYLRQDVTFDDTAARAILDRAGIPRAALDPGAIERLIDLALVSRPMDRRRRPSSRVEAEEAVA